MTRIDWIILGFTLLVGCWGYLHGLTAGALSLGGFALGAVLGSRLAPVVLEGGAESPWASLGALVGALVLGAGLAALLQAVGWGVRARYGSTLGVLDGVGGALLTGTVGLGLVWILGALALHAPAATAWEDDVRGSRVLEALNERLPPSGPLLGALSRIDPFPTVTGPAPGVGAPTARVARRAGVRAAAGGVVRVLGTACGLRVQGSGWIAAPGVVVTNAHVVAGQRDTAVQVRGRGSRLPARAVAFDPRNDLALLRVEGLRGLPPLPLRRGAPPGTAAAVLGFPRDGPYDVRPARLGATRAALTQDAYGRGPVVRTVTAVRGRVRPGNSGGPVVDARGRVVATVFAAGVGGGERGFGVPDEVVRRALRRAAGPVATGPCTR